MDLLASPNLTSLFNVLLRADAGAEVLVCPLILTAEGQEGRLHVGRTVIVPEKAVTEAGADRDNRIHLVRRRVATGGQVRSIRTRIDRGELLTGRQRVRREAPLSIDDFLANEFVAGHVRQVDGESNGSEGERCFANSKSNFES